MDVAKAILSDVVPRLLRFVLSPPPGIRFCFVTSLMPRPANSRYSAAVLHLIDANHLVCHYCLPTDPSSSGWKPAWTDLAWRGVENASDPSEWSTPHMIPKTIMLQFDT